MCGSFLFLLLPFAVFSATVNRFTNIKCESLDTSLIAYKVCDLKVLGRGIVGLNMHMEIYNTTIKNVKHNISLWRKFSGYRPFLYNKTFDFCKFMANSNAKLSFEKIVLGSLIENSNINHSCPYEKDLIIRNLVFKEEFLNFLPLPSGEYKIQILLAFYNIWVSKTDVHILRNEDIMKSK